MALVLADRVRETTTTAGTGTITLLGAVPSCQSFAVVGDGNTTYYTIVAQSGTAWEVGIGTYTAAGTTLSRDTVLSSSNSGSLVNFSTGTKDVFVDYPASKAVYENAAGNVDGYPITGGTINNTVIGGTTPAAGTFTTLTATGQTILGGASGSESLRVLTPVSAAGLRLQVGVPSSTVVRFGPAGSAIADFRLLAPTFINFYTGSSSDGLSDGAAQMRVSNTASAVNYVQVTGAATGARPTISAQGSDAAVDLNFAAKGIGGIYFQHFSVFGSGKFNNWTTDGAVTGLSPFLRAGGGDTNVSAVFQSKGTGAIDLAAGSSGVNISNGGTVTAITRTAAGSAYTSFPSLAITAPTTAGGVQATATPAVMIANAATIASGGTGYAVNDIVTLSGGTPVVTATFTVTAVSGGVVTAVTSTNFGTYSVLPSNPVSTTGGTGSGLTLNVTWAVGTTFTITNAGSGYVEQPTVSFSGGGGSGAAAYATVGSGTVVKSIGNPLSFYTPSGEAFRISDIGVTSAAYWAAYGGASIPELRASGSGIISVTGANSIQFRTNVSTEQLRIAHTASAVNYVQVTGSATGNQPVISTQGSDTNVILNIASKGNASIIFNANSAEQFRTGAVASAVNSLQLNGATTGNSPSLQARGTNTDIDLILTPKGTGLVRFGTYTAGAPTATGYISIKAADGTTYKVLVGT